MPQQALYTPIDQNSLLSSSLGKAMSFLLGPLSGALVAGGVYYGLSSMIQTRNERHRADLHSISTQLLTSTPQPPSAPPASTKIDRHPLTSMIKGRWNTQLEGLFRGVSDFEERAGSWGRSWFYGGNIGEQGK